MEKHTGCAHTHEKRERKRDKGRNERRKRHHAGMMMTMGTNMLLKEKVPWKQYKDRDIEDAKEAARVMYEIDVGNADKQKCFKAYQRLFMRLTDMPATLETCEKMIRMMEGDSSTRQGWIGIARDIRTTDLVTITKEMAAIEAEKAHVEGEKWKRIARKSELASKLREVIPAPQGEGKGEIEVQNDQILAEAKKVDGEIKELEVRLYEIGQDWKTKNEIFLTERDRERDDLFSPAVEQEAKRLRAQRDGNTARAGSGADQWQKVRRAIMQRCLNAANDKQAAMELRVVCKKRLEQVRTPEICTEITR